MSEDKFWECTPLKLNELFRIHKQVEGVENKENEEACIDEIIF